MRQWAVDLSGEARRPGSSFTDACTLIGRSTSLLKGECVFCFMSALSCSHRWLLSLRCDSDYEARRRNTES